jgi:hypothetical protein
MLIIIYENFFKYPSVQVLHSLLTFMFYGKVWISCGGSLLGVLGCRIDSLVGSSITSVLPRQSSYPHTTLTDPTTDTLLWIASLIEATYPMGQWTVSESGVVLFYQKTVTSCLFPVDPVMSLLLCYAYVFLDLGQQSNKSTTSVSIYVSTCTWRKCSSFPNE